MSTEKISKDTMPESPATSRSSDGLGSVKYPATVIVLTHTGKVPCCSKHANQLRNLMSFMGAQTYFDPVGLDAQCSNCVNEAKLPND